MRGVKEVINITKKNNVKMAVLKQKSPSCGYGKVYNGEFSGKIIEGNGILAEELLKKIKNGDEDAVKNDL